MKTKIALMRQLEKMGLSFTANVIINGCGKPCTKMQTIVDLSQQGFDIRHADFETCAIVVEGVQISFVHLDGGVESVKAAIRPYYRDGVAWFDKALAR